MKRAIIIIILLFNLLPSFYNGHLSIGTVWKSQAQTGCWNGGGGIYGDGGFKDFLNGIFSGIASIVNTVANAISDFFSSEGVTDDNTYGEGFGEEFSPNRSYSNYGFDNFRDPGAEAEARWYDDPYFQNEFHFPEEVNFYNELGHYYDSYLAGDNTPPKTEPRYYITVAPHIKRYYNGDTIFVPKRDSALLTLFNENPPFDVELKGTAWKENGITRKAQVKQCYIKTVDTGTKEIKVEDTIKKKPLIKNPLVVYRMPTIIFKRGNNYDGEYGFDDSSHKHMQIRNNPKWKAGTAVTTINGASYNVPWMSLLDGQSATINIEKLNLGNAAKKDPTFSVYFGVKGTIKINGGNYLNTDYYTLQSLKTLTVSATQWDSRADSLKIIGCIYAVTNQGDTIGKLNVSCAKPVKKKVMFVYVNTGSGYASKTTGNFSKQTILDQLNKHSHNQLMREWVLEEKYNYLDTINLTNEYNSNKAAFLNADTIASLSYIYKYFRLHKGISILNDLNKGSNTATLNNADKMHVVFIFTYPANNNISGIGETPGFVSCFFSNADKTTYSHEMGHLLNLHHTFDSPYNIPIHATQNVMDYPLYIGDKTNMFFYCQWVDAL